MWFNTGTHRKVYRQQILNPNIDAYMHICMYPYYPFFVTVTFVTVTFYKKTGILGKQE